MTSPTGVPSFSPLAQEIVNWVLFAALVFGALGSVVIPLLAVRWAHRLGRSQARSDFEEQARREDKIRRQERQFALNRDIRHYRRESLAQHDELISDIFLMLHIVTLEEPGRDPVPFIGLVARLRSRSVIIVPGEISDLVMESTAILLETKMTASRLGEGLAVLQKATNLLRKKRDEVAEEFQNSFDADADSSSDDSPN